MELTDITATSAELKQVSSKLILLRHGVTDWNVQRKFQGYTDIELNDDGRIMASETAEVIAGFGIDVIYSSPLSRAYETANAVAKLVDLPINVDPGLREINVGEWEGLTIDQISELDPEFRLALRSRVDARRSPTGETANETGQRVGRTIAAIAEANQGKTTLIVSHGLAIRAGLANLLGWGFESFWNLGDLPNCGWVTLGWQWNTWRILEYGRSVASQSATRTIPVTAI